MKKQFLRDECGRLVGTIVTLMEYGYEVQEARGENGLKIGKFHSRTNETRDINGHLVGRGNLLLSLYR